MIDFRTIFSPEDYLQEFNTLCDRHDTLRQVLGELSDPGTDQVKPIQQNMLELKTFWFIFIKKFFIFFQDENLEKIPNVFDRLTGGNTNYSLPEILQSAGNNRKRSHIQFDGIHLYVKVYFISLNGT